MTMDWIIHEDRRESPYVPCIIGLGWQGKDRPVNDWRVFM